MALTERERQIFYEGFIMGTVAAAGGIHAALAVKMAEAWGIPDVERGLTLECTDELHRTGVLDSGKLQ